MRQSLFALATAAFLLGACGEQPQTSTAAAPPTTVKASVGSPVTPSGKTRIALLLPLSGGAAPIGQAMQQAAEMALFDTGAKELALAAYDSGDSAETAMEAYRKARTDGVAMVLGPLFGTSAKALAPLVAQGGANVVSFSNDETAAQRGVWIMGIAAPPVGRPGRAGRRRPRQQVRPVHRYRRVGCAQCRLRCDGARRLVCRARSGAPRRLRAPLPRHLRPAAQSPGDACL
jgi:hypothetical protein